jgi:F420-non-reducing hydrogenase iron-sulfur subunit
MARADVISELLEDYGYDAQRFMITWVSSAEPDKFVSAVTAMTDKVRKLGPVRDNTQAV